MSNYQLMWDINENKILEGFIRRLPDGWCIPFDTDNRDYQEYLKWLEAGNTPLPADE